MTRLRLAGALAAGLAIAIVVVGSAAPRADRRPLLPDVQPAAPLEASVVAARTGRGVRHRLAFTSIAENVGDGPLEVVARRPNRRRPWMRAHQLIHRRDGSRRQRRNVGRLRYERNPDHSHWHMRGFMVYELRRTDDYGLVGPDVKTGFCLGDRHPIDDRRIRRAAVDPRFFVNCGKDKPRARMVREGISVGWYDNYDAYLEGQYIDITGVADGRYLLVHRANPARRLREKRYSNNASSALIELTRAAPGERPSVEILRRCRGKPRCG